MLTTAVLVAPEGGALTDETEARLGQVRPFEDSVEDILSLTVQLVHLIQNEEPEDRRSQSLLFQGFIIQSRLVEPC